MYNNTQRLLVTLLALSLPPGMTLAEEAAEEMKIVEAELTPNELELGVGYVKEDAYRFGRYNGLIDQGPYVIGNVKARRFEDNGGFWRLRGTNLGLDSRYLRFDAGVQGRQQFYIEYDQIPDYENDTGVTPFLNPGNNRLVLPADYDYDNLDAFLLPFDQETQRKRLGVGAKTFFKSRWELSGSVSHESREGTDWIGGAMGPSIVDNIFKWTSGALLPEPIDYETDKFNATLRYSGTETQMEFAYNGSLFYNQDESLSWTDPLKNPTCTCKPGSPGCPPRDQCGVLVRPGRMALEPDNQMHQLSAVFGHRLSPANRITALASVSRLSQDEDFLPYSVYDTVDTLPADSLDGEVWLYRGKLKLTSRPIRKLRLSAQYSYDERDNQTDSNPYYYILADGVPGEFRPRYNDPLSYAKNKVDLSAYYRINSKMNLRGGYEFEHIERDYTDEERKTTRENTLTAKFNVKPATEWSFDIFGEYAERSGSTYRTRTFENPGTRVFYLADLEREMVGASVNYMPTDRLSLGLTAEYQQDDYTETEIGLQESEQKSAIFNANYMVSENLNAHAFYSYEEFYSKLAGENLEVEKGTFDVWDGELEDRINSFGVGLTLTGLADKWDAGADWVYTRSDGGIFMQGQTTSVDQVTGEITGTFVPIEAQQFPDQETRLSSLQLWTEYQYSDNIAYRFSYWYEDYDTTDWAVDDVEADSVQQFLLLGEDRLDYEQHVVGVSVKVGF